jgi:endonuclease/exonuclease/phosphatase family metal-dependent hydrolase
VEGTYVLQHCLWDKKLETKWIPMNVYGAAQVENKEEFLSELASLCSKAKEPYVVGDDFNLTRFSYEKNKNYAPSRLINLFNSWINLNELREIHIPGGCFTWSNNQESPTLEKLDRVLMSREWEMMFPMAHIHKNPRALSDHNPLMLMTQFN